MWWSPRPSPIVFAVEHFYCLFCFRFSPFSRASQKRYPSYIHNHTMIHILYKSARSLKMSMNSVFFIFDISYSYYSAPEDLVNNCCGLDNVFTCPSRSRETVGRASRRTDSFQSTSLHNILYYIDGIYYIYITIYDDTYTHTHTHTQIRIRLAIIYNTRSSARSLRVGFRSPSSNATVRRRDPAVNNAHSSW